jgi:hypothetical protein
MIGSPHVGHSFFMHMLSDFKLCSVDCERIFNGLVWLSILCPNMSELCRVRVSEQGRWSFNLLISGVI